MHAQLRADGEKHGRKRIARLMRMAGLVGCQSSPCRRDNDAAGQGGAAGAGSGRSQFRGSGPNRLWVADITFVPDGKWVSLSCRRPRRLEPQDRRLVHGEPPADAELVVDALGMAIGRRRPA